MPHPLVRFRPAALCLLALAPAAGCRARPAEPVVRLVDAVEHAAVEGLPRVRLRWTRERIATIGSPSARDAWRLVTLRLGPGKKESSLRTALAAIGGGRYRIPVELPRAAPRLAFAIGAYGESGAERSAGLSFAIRVRPLDGAGRAIEWRQTLAGERLNAWWEESVDLAPLAGKRVEIELANDGDDGLHGGWATPEVIPGEARDPRPNLLLISLDTVRADHLGAWGYGRPTSPNLDRLAAGGFRFAQAIAQSCWTRPSHRAMLSGLHPLSRGGLPPHPIAEPLWRAGYETLAFTGGGQVDAEFGFAFGFERYDAGDWIRAPEALAARLSQRRGRPLFAFLHTYEPHDPYDDDRFAGAPVSAAASPGFSLGRVNKLRQRSFSEEEKRYVEALYDGDIAFTDAQLGKLLEALRRSGAADDTVIVVTSDHGEQFWEHRSWRHGSSLWDHDIHVPLIVAIPPRVRAALAARTGRKLAASRVIEDQVRSIDIYPTLLDLAGATPLAEVQGRSLLPWLEGGSLPPVEALSESITHRHYELKALRTGTAKLLRIYPHGGTEPDPAADALFDLRRDPAESTNLATAQREATALLAARLEQLVAGGDGAIEDELPDDADPELRRQLEALGYLGGGGGDPD